MDRGTSSVAHNERRKIAVVFIKPTAFPASSDREENLKDRLNVYLLWSAIDHKVDFVLANRVFPRREIVALYDAYINGISTSDKLR
jgi:hypothetical protein